MEAIEEIVIAETTTARSQKVAAGVAVLTRRKSRDQEKKAMIVIDLAFIHSFIHSLID